MRLGQRVAAILLLTGAGIARASTGEEFAAPGWTPSWLWLDTDLNVSREALDTHWSSLVRLPSSKPDYSLASVPLRQQWHDAAGSLLHVEIAPMRSAGNSPQVFLRPQFSLVGSSQSLRHWLRAAGVDATSCTGPVMKMHSSFADSSTRANVSVSARCSFH